MELALNKRKQRRLDDQDLENKIRDFITRNLMFSEDPYPLPNEASFLQNGVIDSLGVVELVTFAGQEFGIQVGPTEITPENFDSVARLAAYIRRKEDPAPGGICAG
jgi:acyl carrier protein